MSPEEESTARGDTEFKFATANPSSGGRDACASPEHVAELIKTALELAPRDRRSFLDEHCRSNPAMRAEVESLLKQEAIANKLIETSAVHLAAEAFAGKGSLSSAEIIGSYEIISLIGRGGMGEVYLAHDQKLNRRVALKLVRFGIDGLEAARHFQREAQILASLNHPNIAQLYGAEITPDGLSFLVMEYIEGVRIDNYCDDNRLSIRDRLEMFRRVCGAVHYAHQRLIVHRDIKPANILITKAGEPKLLDFGIAKLLDPQTSMAGEQTMTFAAAMTPEYASPEQVRGEMMTTAGDVYSLGVVLYELLTGQRPYRIKTRNPTDIARAITEQEPTRPSSALAKRDANSKLLKGDLDNIVLKALRKEPGRRYASVAQFANDIWRHLDGRPVIAHRGTIAYRASKFVRRNRIAITAAAIVLVSLVAGIITTARQAHIAASQRDKARLAGVKAEKINQFLQDTLGFADPGWSSPGAGRGINATIGDALKEASRRAEIELADQPEVLAGVLRTIGSAYLNLGQFDLAQQNQRASLELYQKIYEKDNPEVARSLQLLGEAWALKGNYAMAESLLKQALTIFRKHASDGTVPSVRPAAVMSDLGLIKLTRGDPVGAEQSLREAQTFFPQLNGGDRAVVALALANLGQARAAQGDFDQAENLYRQSIDEYRKLPGRERVELAFSLTCLGDVLGLKAKNSEAETALREALEIARRSAGETNQHAALASDALALVLNAEGKYAEAEKAANDALHIAEQILPEGHLGRSRVLTTFGLILNKTGRSAEAESALRKALAIRERILPKGHWQIAFTKGALGECLMGQKRYPEAEPLLIQSYNDLKKSQGERNPRTIEALERILKLYEATGNTEAFAKYRALLPQEPQ
jgi:tetratricopeptide (TPR) repeat protein/tRNA A-37 threonylcarbamoyl transferase component Bud32